MGGGTGRDARCGGITAVMAELLQRFLAFRKRQNARYIRTLEYSDFLGMIDLAVIYIVLVGIGVAIAVLFPNLAYLLHALIVAGLWFYFEFIWKAAKLCLGLGR